MSTYGLAVGERVVMRGDHPWRGYSGAVTSTVAGMRRLIEGFAE